MSFGPYFLLTLLLAGSVLIMLLRKGKLFWGGFAALLVLWGSSEFWTRSERFDVGLGMTYDLPASIAAFVMFGGLVDIVLRRWQVRPLDEDREAG